MEIYCKNTERYITVPGGTSLLDLSNSLRPELGFRAICARVNNRTQDLSYRLYTPKQVEFLGIDCPSGQRTYVRSLCMLLYKSVADLYPGTRLRIEHSVASGYYCRLFNGREATPEVVARLEEHMRRLIELDMPFERDEKLTTDVIEMFRSQGLNDKVRLLSTMPDVCTVFYRLGDTVDSYYGNLAPSTGHIRAFALLPYKDEFLLMSCDSANPEKAQQPVVQEKMFDAFTQYLQFNQTIGIRNAGEMNLAIRAGKEAVLINVAEALHERYLGRIADDITRRYHDGGARIVLIAGPSSSGKTTTTKRLAIQLMTNLLKPQMISLDDYFINREDTPLDERGEKDFESLYALDLELFNSDLAAMLRGEEVKLPYYNFETGRREYRGNTIRLTEGSILLIEGIHGLNPELTSHIPEPMKYRLYVSALTTLAIDDHNWIPTTDNRLLRRIIRDHRYRGVTATETIRRWPDVRRGEERWIFPYQENADAMFNSSLLFEPAVLKHEAIPILEGVPHNVEEYGEAARLLTFLGYFNALDQKDVPPTSLLREFVGGSSFRY